MGKRESKPIRITKSDVIKMTTKVVVYCLAFLSIYAIAQVSLSAKLGFEVTPVLTEKLFEVFGKELAITCVIALFNKYFGNKKGNDSENASG